MKREEYNIGTLDEYVSAIQDINEKNNSSNTDIEIFYRGQANRYVNCHGGDSIVSSGLRWIRNGASTDGYNKKKIDMFYKQVANRLTALENENFLAYCQHYGLKTPLIDITTDAIVALYFATGESRMDQRSVIYVFLEKNMVDISSEIMKNNFDFDIFQTIFSDSAEDINKLLDYYRVIYNYSSDYYRLFADLINCISDYPHVTAKKSTSLVKNQICNQDDQEDPTGFIVDFVARLIKDAALKVLFYEFYAELANKISGKNTLVQLHSAYDQGLPICYPWYVFILKEYFSLRKDYLIYSEPEFRLPRFPNFLYQPSILYDRMLV